MVRAADTARKQDPQLAAISCQQMTQRGKDHLGAWCVVAAHLAERARAVMRRGTPYVICDTDGRPITAQQAVRHGDVRTLSAAQGRLLVARGQVEERLHQVAGTVVDRAAERGRQLGAAGGGRGWQVAVTDFDPYLAEAEPEELGRQLRCDG